VKGHTDPEHHGKVGGVWRGPYAQIEAVFGAKARSSEVIIGSPGAVSL
jgi:hypothetical protein